MSRRDEVERSGGLRSSSGESGAAPETSSIDRLGRKLRTFLNRAALGVLVLLAPFGAWKIGELVAGLAAPEPAPVPLAEDAGLEELRRRGLLLPVHGVRPEELVDSFEDRRRDGRHEAIDIPAARGTSVLAVEDGTVLGLSEGPLGGLMIQQLDPTGRWVYTYAHLESHTAGLEAGDALSRGDEIATVGTSGNAPPDAPHLHFAIRQRHGEGRSVNPFRVFGGGR